MSSDAFVCGSLVDWFGARHLPHMGAPPALLRVEQLVCTLVATSGLLRLALHRFSHHLGDVRECSFSERRAVCSSFSEPIQSDGYRAVVYVEQVGRVASVAAEKLRRVASTHGTHGGVFQVSGFGLLAS